MPESNIVIFAAGRGSRLGASMPKFLVKVRGLPIFCHQLAAIRNLETQIYVVCGYRASLLVQTMLDSSALLGPMRKNLTFVYNDDYCESQVVSIRRALSAVPLSRPTVFIDGDILFGSTVIQDVAHSSQARVVLREKISNDGVIASTRDNFVAYFQRQIEGRLEWGNIAVYLPDDLQVLKQLVDPVTCTHHFELINSLIQSGRQVQFDVAEIAEVDTVDDLADAESYLDSIR